MTSLSPPPSLQQLPNLPLPLTETNNRSKTQRWQQQQHATTTKRTTVVTTGTVMTTTVMTWAAKRPCSSSLRRRSWKALQFASEELQSDLEAALYQKSNCTLSEKQYPHCLKTTPSLKEYCTVSKYKIKQHALELQNIIGEGEDGSDWLRWCLWWRYWWWW